MACIHISGHLVKHWTDEETDLGLQFKNQSLWLPKVIFFSIKLITGLTSHYFSIPFFSLISLLYVKCVLMGYIGKDKIIMPIRFFSAQKMASTLKLILQPFEEIDSFKERVTIIGLKVQFSFFILAIVLHRIMFTSLWSEFKL